MIKQEIKRKRETNKITLFSEIYFFVHLLLIVVPRNNKKNFRLFSEKNNNGKKSKKTCQNKTKTAKQKKAQHRIKQLVFLYNVGCA